jgi:hypothetical protein
MPNLEWSVAHTLQTPFMNIDINTASGNRYIVQPDTYTIVPSMRVTQDNISQADGSVLHPRWKTGLVATMKLAFYGGTGGDSDDAPACGSQLRVMGEDLAGALTSIQRLTGAAQRLVWQPTGYGDMRMLDQIQVLSWLQPEYDLEGVETAVTFAVESPFPYAIDATENTTMMGTTSAGGSVVITQAGNTKFSPVVRVNGPTTVFTLTNLSDLDELGNPLEIHYDSTRPGAHSIAGGHYAEIDFFRGTVYLDGSGTNLIAGIDPTVSDFFHLVPGDNYLQIVGADCSVLWNNAWA